MDRKAFITHTALIVSGAVVAPHLLLASPTHLSYMKDHIDYEVAIIGGSSAGLAAALTLGRALRKTVVFDSGAPRNQPSPHAHNFFTRDGAAPAELLRIGREQLQRYDSVSLRSGKIVQAQKQGDAFLLTAEDGTEVTARNVILATGLRDILPDIDGLRELWGRYVIHCPFCHGWEVKDRPIAIIMNGDAAGEMLALIRNWNRDLRLFTNGPAKLTQELRDWMTDQDIEMRDTPIASLREDRDGLRVHFSDGHEETLAAVYARGTYHFNNELAVQLGCKLGETGHVVADEMQQTSVPGVFAVGDLAHPGAHQVALAAAAGHKAGLACSRSLIMEDYEHTKVKAKADR